MLKGRSLLFTMIFALAAGAASAEDIIIESRVEGVNNSRYRNVQGTWIASKRKSAAADLTPEARCGSRKVILSARKNEGLGAVARFTPMPPSPMKLHTYLTWPRGANVAPVQVRIQHAGGTAEVTLSQDGYGAQGASNSNSWIPVGEYEFGPSADHFIELRAGADAKALDPGSAAEIYADAARFTSAPLPPEKTGPELPRHPPPRPPPPAPPPPGPPRRRPPAPSRFPPPRWRRHGSSPWRGRPLRLRLRPAEAFRPI